MTEEPIRVLHVIGNMNRGGAETLIMNLYRSIDRSRVQFDFVVHTDQEASYDKEILSLGGVIYHCPRFIGTNYLSYRRWWKRFFESDGRAYRIVHGHIGSSASIYLSIAKRHGCFTIAHSHNTTSLHDVRSLAYAAFSFPTRYVADFFFTCSDQAGRDRFGKRVVSGKRYRVWNNAIDAASFRYSESTRRLVRDELKLAPNALVIGHVGRFVYQKNHAFLIDIFEELLKRRPDAVLLLVGDGPLRAQIESLCMKKSLSDHVILTGVRTDIDRLMQAMDVFTFPSVYEGFGLVLVEAQAAGLPCVTSDCIQNEAILIPSLVKRLSLQVSPAVWSDAALRSVKDTVRDVTTDIIRGSGYDISESADRIVSFYLDHCPNIHEKQVLGS